MHPLWISSELYPFSQDPPRKDPRARSQGGRIRFLDYRSLPEYRRMCRDNHAAILRQYDSFMQKRQLYLASISRPDAGCDFTRVTLLYGTGRAGRGRRGGGEGESESSSRFPSRTTPSVHGIFADPSQFSKVLSLRECVPTRSTLINNFASSIVKLTNRMSF